MSDDLRDTLFPVHGGPIDPVELARRDLKKVLPKRFYKVAEAGQVEGGFGLLLDGKPVRTPGKALLAVPTEPLAEALAAEWRAQGEWIEPDTMPMTRIVNSAIDGVAHHLEPTIAEVSKFAETDLICYRAGDPESLVAAQSAAWDPMLAFARDTLGARFVCAEGVMYVAQPDPAQAAVRAAVEALASGSNGPLHLAALSVMTSLTGSVVIALAVMRGALTAEAAWEASLVDEVYQMRLWGPDDEALDRRARRWRDMKAAAEVVALSR